MSSFLFENPCLKEKGEEHKQDANKPDKREEPSKFHGSHLDNILNILPRYTSQIIILSLADELFLRSEFLTDRKRRLKIQIALIIYYRFDNILLKWFQYST